MNRPIPREGELFEIVCIAGHQFTIRYGYYTEEERDITEPIPIYPCFLTDPHYTEEGRPLVTRIQDACEYYETGGEAAGDRWCADCVHCVSKNSEIGICECEHRRRANKTMETG